MCDFRPDIFWFHISRGFIKDPWAVKPRGAPWSGRRGVSWALRTATPVLHRATQGTGHLRQGDMEQSTTANGN